MCAKGFAMTQSPWAHTNAHPTKSEWDSADAKPYKHTQTLAIRKEQRDSTDTKSYRHTNARSAKNENDNMI